MEQMRYHPEREPKAEVLEYQCGQTTVREFVKKKKSDRIILSDIQLESPNNGTYSLRDELPPRTQVMKWRRKRSGEERKESQHQALEYTTLGIHLGNELQLGSEEKRIAVAREEDSDSRGIRYDSLGEFWSHPESILTLLHEAGHIRRAAAVREQEGVREGMARRSASRKYRGRQDKKRRAVIRSQGELNEYVREVLADERDAWAYALNMYRKYDFGDLNRQELLRAVHGALGSYETDVAQRFGEAYVKHFQEKYLDALEGDLQEFVAESHRISRMKKG